MLLAVWEVARMNKQFAQSRQFYLELAKLNGSWDMIRTCAANVHRLLEKEKATAETVTR